MGFLPCYKSGSDNNIISLVHLLFHGKDIFRPVLPIPVKLYGIPVTVPMGIFKPGLERSGKSQIHRQVDNLPAMLSAYLCCLIGRSVINDHIIKHGIVRDDISYHTLDV